MGGGEQNAAHRMAGCRRWVLRAWVRTSGEKGGWPERRWTSRCAALLRAWTPASVRLEMINLTGKTEFSLSAASCGDRAAGGGAGSAIEDQSPEGPPPVLQRRGALICPSPGSPPSIPGDGPAELTSR